MKPSLWRQVEPWGGTGHIPIVPGHLPVRPGRRYAEGAPAELAERKRSLQNRWRMLFDITGTILFPLIAFYEPPVIP